MPSSWISLTSLLLITFVFLSITTSKAEGKRGDVEKVGKGQALGGPIGKEGPGKAKLKLKKRKQKRRKTASKKVAGKKEQKSKRGKGNDRKTKGKGKKNKKQNPKDKKKKKNKKKTKKNDNRKLSTRKEKEKGKTEPEVKADSEKEGSEEKEASRQIATADADPDRYKHCDYLDLVEVGYREDSICKPGDKMVFKGGKGIRRQFLMTPQTNVVVFLEQGKKVTSCNNTFNDITSKVRCKPVNGVSEITGIEKTNGGATCLDCPARSDGCKPAEETTPTVASDTEVHCRCPEERTFICTYRVESNGNSHTVTCNRNTVTKIYCGSDLVAKTTVNNPVERYSQPLCTTKEYTSILIDLKFSCKDKSIPVPSCEKCEGECETKAPDTTTSGSVMTTAMPRRFRDFRIFHNL